MSAGAEGSSSGPINWAEVHARLGRLAAETADATSPTPERAREILEGRAELLARVPVPPRNADESLVVLSFRLGDEPYAIEARHVRRVVPFQEATIIPGAPDVLAGVINHRGEVLAVFDLGKLFGVASQSGDPPRKVIVLGGGRDEFGILADATDEVTILATDELLDPPGSLESVGRAYVRGVTARAQVVLDGERLLQDERLFIDQGEEIGG